MKAISKIYTALIFIFLYAPILILIIFSFNTTKSRSVFSGFTLNWYAELFKDDMIMNALANTIIIALIAMVVSTLLGTAAALGIHAMNKKLRGVMMTTNNIPMVNPEIVTGVSMSLLFVFAIGILNKAGFDCTLNLFTLAIAHITFDIPYVVLSVAPKLRQMNSHTYEAALDLGCTPMSALFKVILPEIMPGIITGAIMAFTMSLDDFVISYFTSGAESQTLPLVIYSMTKRKISPKINAMSAILFVTVLILLIIVNVRQRTDDGSAKKKKRGAVSAFFHSPKKVIGSAVALVILISVPVAILSSVTDKTVTINVYNWGENISDGTDDTMDVVEQFEQETGIKVNYSTYQTNEDLYQKLKTGGVSFDVIIPSDYMIGRMIKEDMLEKLNFDNIPNYSFVDEKYKTGESISYDPQHEYSVPYTAGRVGLIYNADKITEEVDSWQILWDEKYKNNILMFDNPRDAFGISQIMLSQSLNSESETELEQAAELLRKQKAVAPVYAMDQIMEKMPSGDAYVAPYYIGDCLTMYAEALENDVNLKCVIPKEGTNVFVDAMCVPKGTKHKAEAEQFINFMLRTDVALANIEYIAYTSPQKEAADLHKKELIEEYGEEIADLIYPDELGKVEMFKTLSDKANQKMTELWTYVKK